MFKEIIRIITCLCMVVALVTLFPEKVYAAHPEYVKKCCCMCHHTHKKCKKRISILSNVKYDLSKFFIHTIGRTSKGVNLCLNEGLTSGKTLDYIYQNNPQGSFIIGKMIDRQFLNNPGWQGVRWRRANLETLLTEAIIDVRNQNKSISLVDIASGPGSYILSVIGNVGEDDVVALCRDLDERWLAEGSRAAETCGLRHVRFEKGDAFNEDELQALQPKPNIIVSSGFYDWIVDDEKVKLSITMSYNTLEEGGCIIVTNQTAHPNLEFVERVFSDFNNEPLRMTMRSKDTMNQWLEEAGFEVEKTLSDPYGYYSVTKARKIKR